jgi:hypothetical protein
MIAPVSHIREVPMARETIPTIRRPSGPSTNRGPPESPVQGCGSIAVVENSKSLARSERSAPMIA